VRRTVLALLLTVGLAVGAAAPVTAEPGAPGPPELPGPAADIAGQAAEEALESAQRVLEGEAEATDADPSLALRDLFLALPRLSGGGRREARALLARPTDGFNDAYQDGYTTSSSRICSTNFCVHYADAGTDAPPSTAWVRRNLNLMEYVWGYHVGRMGYRKPLPDGQRGGDDRFDVYLKDVGPKGYYGYCATEDQPDRTRFRASGFCVLDNDFSRAEYGAPPMQSLRVTAAHEFFHALQYAYDFAEDRWLLEATATWMEERYADDADDNRQFLPAGQLANPGDPLDTHTEGGAAQYGNWAFFEHLSQRFGNGIVRAVWNRAADTGAARDRHSVAAVRSAVAQRRVAFPTLFAQYAAGNTVPARSYSEGQHWPGAPVAATYRLSPDKRGTGKVPARLDHLTSTSWDVRRGGFGGNWKLLVKVDGPPAWTSPVAHAMMHMRNGKVVRRLVRLNRFGDAKVRLPFNGAVGRVTVTVANASTRYRCWQGTTFACQGTPRDDGRPFTFAAYAVR
jgi:hypothetical protein